MGRTGANLSTEALAREAPARRDSGVVPVARPASTMPSQRRAAARVDDNVGSHGGSAAPSPAVAAIVSGMLGAAPDPVALATSLGAGVGSLGSGCSHVKTGSSNVFIEGKAAARAGDDNDHGADCKLREGSATVFVNGRPLARVGDRARCGGAITVGARRVDVGGGTTESAANNGGSIQGALGRGLLQLAANEIGASEVLSDAPPPLAQAIVGAAAAPSGAPRAPASGTTAAAGAIVGATAGAPDAVRNTLIGDHVGAHSRSIVEGLPEDATILRRGGANGESWVVYRPSAGEDRIRFRASEARTGAPINRGRAEGAYSVDAEAGLTQGPTLEQDRVFVLEGRHRAVGAAHGEEISPELGGVRGQPGVLDYEFYNRYYSDTDGHDVRDLTAPPRREVSRAEAEQLARTPFGDQPTCASCEGGAARPSGRELAARAEASGVTPQPPAQTAARAPAASPPEGAAARSVEAGAWLGRLGVIGRGAARVLGPLGYVQMMIDNWSTMDSIVNGRPLPQSPPPEA